MAIVKVKKQKRDRTTDKYVEVEVFSCEECGRWDEDRPENIFHDALCCSRGGVRGETDRARVLAELFKRANHLLGQDLDGVQKALRDLREMKVDPRCVPDSFEQSDHYAEGDENCPFFSESFLYCLLGKEDARTVLAYVNAVFRAAGLEPR